MAKDDEFFKGLRDKFVEDQMGSGSEPITLKPLPNGLGAHPVGLLAGNMYITLLRMGVPEDLNTLLVTTYAEQVANGYIAEWHGDNKRDRKRAKDEPR